MNLLFPERQGGYAVRMVRLCHAPQWVQVAAEYGRGCSQLLQKVMVMDIFEFSCFQAKTFP